MSILSKTEILDCMAAKKDPLVVTPLLQAEQVGAASVDVRLGHEFIILRRSSIPNIDPTTGSKADWEAVLRKWQERVRISLFRPFVLPPGQLVLGATLEYVSIPSSIAAAVEGRSSWGRLGLIIATAATVGPGFKGCVTLELINEGGVPLVFIQASGSRNLCFSVPEYPANTSASMTAPQDRSSAEFMRIVRCLLGLESRGDARHIFRFRRLLCIFSTLP